MTASGLHAAAQQLRQHLAGVAEQSDRDRALPDLARALEHLERLIEAPRLHVQVARLQPLRDALRPALDREHGGAGHGRGERLRAAHAAQARGQDPLAG